MDSQLLTVRYPEGFTEFILAAEPLKVGETLERAGDEWRVVAVEGGNYGETVVTLAPIRGGGSRRSDELEPSSRHGLT